MSEKKKIIDLAPLSEEQITQDGNDYNELWMIKSKDGEMFGPFDTESIKNYAAQYDHLFQDAMAYNLAQETWKNFFKVAKFQRRKPKLVPMHSLMTTDNFIILLNGEKKGPFTLDQIQNFVDDKKIALNVQVSLDNGESWIKLFEHHAFDRRLKKNSEDLPFVPNNNIFEHNLNTNNLKVDERNKIADEEDALIGLAFISTGNDKGQTLHKNESNVNSTPKTINKKAQLRSLETKKFSFLNNWVEKINFKYIGSGIIGLFVLFTALNSFNSSFNNDSEIQKTKKVVNTKKESINNSARRPKTSMAKKSPTKIVRAKKYRPKPQRRARPTRRPAQSQRKRRQVHRDERFEVMDIDDPAIKEELTRELAGDTYGDSYDELTEEQRDFIERANQEGLGDGDYEDMQRRDDQYDTVEDFE